MTAYVTYPQRWTNLAIFCCLEMSSVILWVTFAPISNLVQDYFDQESFAHSITAVNMMANIFYIMYAPGTILGNLSVSSFGIRNTFIIASVITALGALFRYIATVASDMSQLQVYYLMFLGQALAAIVQPFLLNMPATISMLWFASNERDIATTIGAMVCPLSLAIGQIIPVVLVSKDEVSDDDVNVKGMDDLMLTEFILVLVPLFLTLFFFSALPPSPPSKAAEQKIILITNPLKRDSSTINGDTSQLFTKLQSLYSNRHYVQLFCAFSLGVGFFYTLLTLLNQLIRPHGYSNDDAGTFGSVFIVFGLVGAALTGYVMERTKAYRTILKVEGLASVFSAIFLLGMLYKDNFAGILVAFSILGFFALPLLPVMMENCAEVTHPLSEELTVGILYMGGNVSALAFIFITQALLGHADRGGVYPPSSIFLCTLIFLAALCLVTYRGPYVRSEYENLRDDGERAEIGQELAGEEHDSPFHDGRKELRRSFSDDGQTIHAQI